MASWGFKDIFDRIITAVSKPPDPALVELGQRAITIISLRTRKGLDADGQKFVPYTYKYAIKRLRKKLGLTPDLTVTGQMLGAMTSRITGTGEVTIEFSGTKEIAKALGNSRYRDFFDIRQETELDAIAEDLADELIAEILK